MSTDRSTASKFLRREQVKAMVKSYIDANEYAYNILRRSQRVLALCVELDGIISRASGCRHRINTSVFNVSSVPRIGARSIVWNSGTLCGEHGLYGAFTLTRNPQPTAPNPIGIGSWLAVSVSNALTCAGHGLAKYTIPLRSTQIHMNVIGDAVVLVTPLTWG